MNTVWLVLELLLIVVLAVLLFIGGAGWIALLLVLVWTARAIQRFLNRRQQQKLMTELGYEENPVMSASKLMKRLRKEDFAGVLSVNVYSMEEYKNSPDWQPIINIFEKLKPKASASSLGTSNVLINIVGGYLVSEWAKRQESKTRVMVVVKDDGKYFFAPATSVSTKKLRHFYKELKERGVPVNDNVRKGSSSFQLAS